MMWHWGWGWGWGGAMAMGGLMVLLVAVVIALVVWVAVWAPAQHTHRPREDTRALLDRRLASGEITPEEYSRARTLIEDGPRDT